MSGLQKFKIYERGERCGSEKTNSAADAAGFVVDLGTRWREAIIRFYQL